MMWGHFLTFNAAISWVIMRLTSYTHRDPAMPKRKRSVPAPQKSNLIQGADLSLLRKRAGVTLEHVAAKTKISMRFLQAIEAGDYEQLPGGIFNTNYLRQYAETVGMDPEELFQRYNRKMNPQPETPKGNQRTTDSRSFLHRLFGVPA